MGPVEQSVRAWIGALGTEPTGIGGPLVEIAYSLARHLDGTERNPGDKAGRDTTSATAKELRATLMEIEALPGGRKAEPLDDLAKGITDDLAQHREQRQRRTSRRADAAGS